MALWIYIRTQILIQPISSFKGPGISIRSKFAKLEGIYIPSLPPITNNNKQTQNVQ